jgi:hypothetical protein
MYDVILAIVVLVIIFLGVRLVMKFREMSSWKDEDAVVGGKGNSALPPELRELRIEEPPEELMNRIDAPEEKGSSAADTPPKQT